MTVEELRDHLEIWKKAWPQLTKKGMTYGASIIQKDIKRKWSDDVLRTESGDLVKSIRIKATLNPLAVKVYVKGSQQYKAQTHEQGRHIIPKNGSFFQINPVGIGKSRGEYYGRPREVSIPPRPVWEASKSRNMAAVLRVIEETIVKGYTQRW
jgi:hypothetical protein